MQPGEQDLASLLAAGEQAAFHGPPAGAVASLEAAVLAAQRQRRPAEATAAAWLLGVALGAGGRYGGALTVLVPLVDSGEAGGPEQRLFGALAAATAASLYRQLGRHDDARGYDERGLAIADGSAEAVFDCRLGLASDAVGSGDLAEARDRLEVAAALVGDRDDWWRQRVRLDWVRAEVALLAGEPGQARGVAAEAVTRAEAARAPRHVAKGLLFEGVAAVEAGAEEDAIATLRRAATLAEGLATLPLVWRTRALLGALLAGLAEESARSLAAARSAVLAIAGDLPPELRTAWLARPDVTALLEG